MSTPSFWKSRNVLVTGATGLLGGHLCAELVARGANVVTLVRDHSPRSQFFATGLDTRCGIVRGALEDAPLLARALNEWEIDTVFHLGAQTIVRAGHSLPPATFHANIHGTWNVLEACRLNSGTVRRVIVASSDKAYGSQPVLPYTEDMPLLAVHPYDVSKACADRLTTSYAVSCGVPAVVTRLANLYGPWDLNLNRIIPDTCVRLARGEGPVIRSDGTPRRDFIHVRDAVAAYLSLADRLEGLNLAGQAFNFGNGQPVPVVDLVKRLVEIHGPGALGVRILGEPLTGKEIPEQWLDSAKARTLLGWEPSVPFDDGLRETAAWYAEHFG